MTSDKPPTCLLCGAVMREELGMERSHEGLVQRWWTCPRCLHRQTTIDSDEDDSRTDEGRQQCIST